MKLPSLSGILKKPSYMVILSLLIAVLAWFVVINTAPDQERLVTVKNIPVNTTAATTATPTPTSNQCGTNVNKETNS